MCLYFCRGEGILYILVCLFSLRYKLGSSHSHFWCHFEWIIWHRKKNSKLSAHRYVICVVHWKRFVDKSSFYAPEATCGSFSVHQTPWLYVGLIGIFVKSSRLPSEVKGETTTRTVALLQKKPNYPFVRIKISHCETD